MKKTLFLYIGLIFSATVMFGQEIPELKVTVREMNGIIDRCADDNQTVVEVQSYLPLTFESTMDKTITFCDMKQENGFYVYQLLFSTDEKYKGRKLKIKTTGFDTYMQTLDLKAKIHVHLLVSNKADDSYNAGKSSETLKEYEKVDSINSTDEYVKNRRNQGNEKISKAEENNETKFNFVFKVDKYNYLFISSVKLYLDNQLIGEANHTQVIEGFQFKYRDAKPGAHELRIVCSGDIPDKRSYKIDTSVQKVFEFENRHKKTGFGNKVYFELVK
jgi:hypothetical protein